MMKAILLGSPLATSISMVGLTVIAVLIPAGIILTLLAFSRFGHARRFQIAAATAFALIALWSLVSVSLRTVRGDFGMLFALEIVLMVGFALQAWWIGRAKL